MIRSLKIVLFSAWKMSHYTFDISRITLSLSTNSIHGYSFNLLSNSENFEFKIFLSNRNYPVIIYISK